MFLDVYIWSDVDQGIRRICYYSIAVPLCVGEIELEDLSFDRQTDSAMVTWDPSPATPHPSFVATSVYFRCLFSSYFINYNNLLDLFGFAKMCCIIDRIIGFSVSRSVEECYRSHSMFARRSLTIREEWVSVVGNVSENLNLDFLVPPFFLIFWRIPGYHVLKAPCKTPLRYVTINFARRKFSLNVNPLELSIHIPLNSCHSLEIFRKPKPWNSEYLPFLNIVEDVRMSCSQCILQDSHEVQKNGSRSSEIFTKS